MVFNLTNWTILYVVNTVFLIGSMIIFWTGMKDFILKRNYQRALFGFGLIVIAFSYLAISLYNNVSLPPGIIYSFVIGLNAILISLIRKKYEYLFLLLNSLLLLIATDGRYAFLFSVVPIALAYLAFNNYCQNPCSNYDCEKKKDHNNEWVFFFLLMAASFVVSLFIQGGYYQITPSLLISSSIGIEALMTGAIFYHILRCNHYSNKETLMISLAAGFLLVASLSGFYINQKFSTFIEDQLREITLKETKAALIISENFAEPETLPELIESENMLLNDIADQVLIETGFRTTFFKGNRRVGAPPSASSGGRFLGTILDDSAVNKAVLEEGRTASIKLLKGGQYSVASYVPVRKDGQVIGMIGTGIFLTSFYELQNRLLYAVILTMVIAAIVIYLILANDLPKKK